MSSEPSTSNAGASDDAVANRPLTYFDITLGGQPIGRVVFRLYNDLVPKTAENFRMSYVLLGVKGRADRVALLRTLIIFDRAALATMARMPMHRRERDRQLGQTAVISGKHIPPCH
jgi:hypothetical protein